MSKKEIYAACVRKILLEFRDAGKNHISLEELKAQIQEEIKLPQRYVEITGELWRHVLKPGVEMVKKDWPDFTMNPVEHGRQKVTAYEFHFAKVAPSDVASDFDMLQHVKSPEKKQTDGKLCFSISAEDFHFLVKHTKVKYTKKDGASASRKRWVSIQNGINTLRATSLYYQKDRPEEYMRHAFAELPYPAPIFHPILLSRSDIESIDNKVTAIIKTKAQEIRKHRSVRIHELKAVLRKKFFIQCYQWMSPKTSPKSLKYHQDFLISFLLYAPSFHDLCGRELFKRRFQPRVEKNYENDTDVYVMPNPAEEDSPIAKNKKGRIKIKPVVKYLWPDERKTHPDIIPVTNVLGSELHRLNQFLEDAYAPQNGRSQLMVMPKESHINFYAWRQDACIRIMDISEYTDDGGDGDDDDNDDDDITAEPFLVDPAFLSSAVDADALCFYNDKDSGTHEIVVQRKNSGASFQGLENLSASSVRTTIDLLIDQPMFRKACAGNDFLYAMKQFERTCQFSNTSNRINGVKKTGDSCEYADFVQIIQNVRNTFPEDERDSAHCLLENFEGGFHISDWRNGAPPHVHADLLIKQNQLFFESSKVLLPLRCLQFLPPASFDGMLWIRYDEGIEQNHHSIILEWMEEKGILSSIVQLIV